MIRDTMGIEEERFAEVYRAGTERLKVCELPVSRQNPRVQQHEGPGDGRGMAGVADVRVR